MDCGGHTLANRLRVLFPWCRTRSFSFTRQRITNAFPLGVVHQFEYPLTAWRLSTTRAQQYGVRHFHPPPTHSYGADNLFLRFWHRTQTHACLFVCLFANDPIWYFFSELCSCLVALSQPDECCSSGDILAHLISDIVWNLRKSPIQLQEVRSDCYRFAMAFLFN